MRDEEPCKMRLARVACLAMGLAVPARAATLAPDAGCVSELVGKAQPRVAAFIQREQMCMRWAGDEPVSAQMAHASATPKLIRELSCDKLERDEAALRKQFARDPPSLRALDRADKQLC